MLSLLDVIARNSPPAPWSEGDNIPWDNPEFSSRMLCEHLSQDHDLASRRTPLIDNQVAWLVDEALPAPPARVLDLGCGPGLYLNRLADRGYTGTGIDFSPASINYARSQAQSADAPVEYRLHDLRTSALDSGYGAALLLYGQLNVFRRSEARSLLARVHDALEPGGVLVVEPQTFDHINASGQAPSVWSSHNAGLFSSDPHVLLVENHWSEEAAVSTQRFFVIDAQTGAVTRHALSNEAYTADELTDLLADAGFVHIDLRGSITGEETGDGLCALTGVKA